MLFKGTAREGDVQRIAEKCGLQPASVWSVAKAAGATEAVSHDKIFRAKSMLRGEH